MTQRALSWDELRTFVEVARDGSLSGAARRLGLSQPTVGRHIDALEATLGSTLFTRSPRGLTPTPAGRMSLTAAPESEELRVRERSFVVENVLRLDAAAEDFSDHEKSDAETSVVKFRSRGIVR